MDEDRVKTLTRALEMAVSGETAGAADVFTEDVVGWSPAMTVRSRAELVAELADRVAAFSDVALSVDATVGADGRVFGEWRLELTHTGPLRIDDDVLEPTGRRITLRGITVAVFTGPRIAEFRQYWDEADLLEGLGLLPAS
ncbi:ester cyclase [Actinocatenispora rupis]|uniref:SnoaL-like domain-containing protein n=1 Tax=Actinocatenispora rupis TaxID=519421 RepID=A0A8J3J2M9_9ACTN|nr:ester cyclase [Actinocatenispora rupis]GID14666.1 hypothetical protein Aru02nite_55550 [Actinocatenispora rupis]